MSTATFVAPGKAAQAVQAVALVAICACSTGGTADALQTGVPNADGGTPLILTRVGQDGGNTDASAPTAAAVKRRMDGRQEGKVWVPFAAHSGPLRIGAAANGANGFNGLIDRVRVYNVAISDEDMVAHAQGTYEPCADSPECVADWTFDQAQDGSFPSTGRKLFPAKIVGEVATVASRDGKAIDIKMNGIVATGWVEVAFDPAFDLREEFSLESWVLFTNDCGSKCAFYNVYDRAPAFDLEVHGGAWGLRAAKGPILPALAGFPNGKKWSHIGITYTKYELRVFKDGKLVKTLNP